MSFGIKTTDNFENIEIQFDFDAFLIQVFNYFHCALIWCIFVLIGGVIAGILVLVDSDSQ